MVLAQKVTTPPAHTVTDILLRYLHQTFAIFFTGAATDGDRTLAGGHAVLASHRRPGENFGRSAHGLYIESFYSPVEGIPYRFAKDSGVPLLIASEIDRIRDEYGHGTAVIIPAFNHFEDDHSLWTIVSRAAACNFFQAIHSGQLIVEVEDLNDDAKSPVQGTNVQVLNANTLLMVLEKYKDERRIGATWCILVWAEGKRSLSVADARKLESSRDI